MGARTVFAGAAAAALAAAILAAGCSGRGADSAEARAASVVRTFFQSIDRRQYERTCALLSARFFREHHVASRARCALGLRVGFMWSPSIRFRILRVRIGGRRAVVTAVANGAPGRIVLVDEHGSFRVLSVRGA